MSESFYDALTSLDEDCVEEFSICCGSRICVDLGNNHTNLNDITHLHGEVVLACCFFLLLEVN